MKRTREHIERQEEELQVLGAIYMDDCKDMRKKKSDLPKVCLQLKPLQSVVDKEVHASVDLIVQYTAIYPDQSPKLSLDNVRGLSKVSTSQLQEELEIMAADLVGEVMVLQLAHHVQSFLHKHNIPRLSFYDQMMTNKREEQRRIEAAEKERLREQMEASKEKEEEEKRLIEAELMRREEILRKSRRRRSMIERGETDDQFQQSVKPKDTKENKVVSSAKDLPTSNGEGKVYPLNNVSSLPHSPKKVELSSSDHLITRRKKSSESLGETDTGSRIITFNMKGEHTIYCGRCLGQGSSGSYMYRGMDGTSGDLIVVGEWRFLHPSNLVSPSKINEVPSQDSGHLMKQITSIEQEIVSLTIRVNHPNLVHYLAVKVNDSSDNVVIQVLMEYVGGGDMSMFLRPGGIPVAQVKKYIQQLLESLWYLHGKSVVHKDLKLTNVMLDSSGNVRLADYSVGKRLSDLYDVYGMDEGNIPQPKTVEPSKALSRPGKKGDVFNLGLLVLSLLCGDVVEIAEVPLSLPADLQDFLSKCLNVDERERWSAYQLLQHSFIKQQVPCCVVRNEERITGSTGGENALATKKCEPEEPIPDFCFFSCVSGKSRLNDFEQLQFLGKGGFGNVIKVRNILDGGLYAIKRIPLNPKSTQFNRKITREVQLISRVNHENVVRYYNSWIEWSEDDSDSNLTDGGETPVTKAQKDNALPSPQNSNEDSLMKLNIVEAPSIKGTSDEGSWCSYVSSETSESESSSNSSICEIARQNVLSKRIGSSFGISESGSGGITFGNFDESFLQFGDLLDTESEDSEEGSMWPTTTSESSTDSKGIQYLYIQMEYCEKNTLRNLIDEGLFKDQDKIWRHLREIVDGLAHIHSQGIIHRDLKPVNLFLDSNGNIKIGDFGLATTHDISRDGGLFLETHTSERPPFKESEGLHTSDAMTGKVGTTFYVAPELAQSSSRVKYSEKVDLYSLGIILFEMCYRPLTTAMERAHVLGNVRMENIIFPSDFDSKRLQQQDAILKWLLQHKPDKRPTSQELLQSQYIPPKIEDGHLEEVLQHTLQSTKTTRYKRLVAAMFKQRVTPIQDVMYDDMNDMERPSGISYCNTMAQQAVHEKLIFLFRRHGAIKLSTSLLVPRTSLFDQFELAVSVMDHNGTIVTLPYDLRIPFARFVARRKISHMKRYDIGVVYRDKRALDPNPKELLECTFDIVSDSNEDQVSVAEVFLVVAEIIKEFPSLEGRNYFIRINHTVIMKSVFVSCGVPEEKHEELFAILQDTKTDKFRKAQISELLENLQVSEQLASELCAFLSFEGSVGKLKEQLPAILKGRAPTRASAQALRELEALQSHALAFGVKLRLVFNSSLVYNVQHFSGLIFQFVAVDQRKRKRGGVDILAAGGRYDKLISYFQRATDASRKAIEAVGVSIAFEKIVTAVLDDKETLLPYSSDVLVCSTGSKSMMEERMRIAQELWCAGVKTNLYYYDSRNLNSLEDLQNYCRQTNVGFMVLVKEQESGWVKVWSLKKEKMTEVRTTDLTEYISTKLASCRADAMDGKETGTKLPTHGSQTVSESILSSGPSFSYVLNVSFNTLEKVDKSIKKRHESQMLSKISPKVQQIGIKTIVEIIGVDLPGSVIRNMASQLELDGNYDSYEASIARLTENTPTKLKKYIARVCDNVRELIQDKKMPMVFVYSLKDETYKAFY